MALLTAVSIQQHFKSSQITLLRTCLAADHDNCACWYHTHTHSLTLHHSITALPHIHNNHSRCQIGGRVGDRITSSIALRIVCLLVIESNNVILFFRGVGKQKEEKNGEREKRIHKYPGGEKKFKMHDGCKRLLLLLLSEWMDLNRKSEFHIYTSHTHTKKNQATLRRNKNCLTTLPKCWLILSIVRHLLFSFFLHSSLPPSRPILYSSLYISLLWIPLTCFSAMTMLNF